MFLKYVKFDCEVLSIKVRICKKVGKFLFL
jgi:hypothetical protein